MNEFERCLRDGRIVRYEVSEAMIQKELAAAQLDLDTAMESLGKGNVKWATTQGYYSMFHSAKALVLWKVFRERSHWCLLVALRELLVRTGELAEDLAEDLELCMGVRHGADYALEYDGATAGRVVDKARAWLVAATAILTRSGVVSA
jgi:uncharacterized protein (UPF0332 family)